MAQIVSFYDRGGDNLLYRGLIEVVPRRSESVSLTTDDGRYIQSLVFNVCHSLPKKSDAKIGGVDDVRISVLLEWPK
jgi:hypothetical protein